MASLLGNLRVRLTAETEDFRRGLTGARTNLTSFRKELNKFSASSIAKFASVTAVVGGLTAGLAKSIGVATELGKAERELSASAKIAGQDLDTLRGIVTQATSQFSLGKIAATEFTTELARLADRAGGLKEPTRVLQSFLDLGAARGLNAAETLDLFREAVKGSEDAIYKFFNQKPDQLYQRFAASIGTTVSQLTEQQKAQALGDAALADGAAARGEYAKWLQTTEGLQFQLSQGMENGAAVIGQALQPAISALVPVLKWVGDYVAELAKQWQELRAELDTLPKIWKAIGHAVTGNFGAAGKELEEMAETYRATMAKIRAVPTVTLPGIAAPLTGRGAPAAPKTDDGKDGKGKKAKKEEGKKDAQAYFDGFQVEWENLRSSVTLVGLEVTGTDSQRLAEEEAHELRLLDIEEQHIQARHRLKELTDSERDQSMRELGVRREIVKARRIEMEAARATNDRLLAGFARQAALLDDAVERTRMLGDASLTRLGAEGSIEDRLRIQLRTADEVAEIKRGALLADTRLSDTQLETELQLLDLALEREKVALRMSAEAERAAREQDRHRSQVGSLKDLGLSVAGDVLSGRGLDVGGIGAGLGMVAGTALGGPIGGEVLSTIGGALGSLFGDGKDDVPRIINQLQAIEFNTAETITAISEQTDKLLNLDGRVFGAPTNFSIPGYAPQFGGGGGGSTNVRNDYQVAVNVNVTSPAEVPDISRAVETAVARAIRDGRDSAPRSSLRF